MADASLELTNSRRHILDGAVRVFLAEALFPLTSIITAIFLTRRLGADGYGLLALTISAVMWFLYTLNAIFNKSLVRAIRTTPEWRPLATRAIHFQLQVSLLGMVLVWILAGPFADWMGSPALAAYIRLGSLEIPIANQVHLHRRFLVGLGRYRHRALTGALHSLARLGLVVLFVEMGLSVFGAILGLLGANIVELVIIRVLVHPPVFARSTYRIRDMVDYIAPLFLAAICQKVFIRSDLIMLKGMGGTEDQAGLYAAAQNMALVPIILLGAVTPLFLSSLAELKEEHGFDTARALAGDVLRLAILTWPLIAVGAGAAPSIVELIYGSAFAPTAPILRLLLLGAAALLPLSVYFAILTVAERPSWCFYISLPLMLMALVGHWQLIPLFGPYGAAATTATLSFVAFAVTGAAVHRIWSIAPPTGSLLRSALISPLAYAIPVLWPARGPWILLQVVVLCLVMIGLLVLVGELRGPERQFILRHLAKRPSLKKDQEERP